MSTKEPDYKKSVVPRKDELDEPLASLAEEIGMAELLHRLDPMANRWKGQQCDCGSFIGQGGRECPQCGEYVEYRGASDV